MIFGILAFVQRKDQPVEVYLASLMRFFLVPRVKKWDQDGLTETVKIIAPKKEEKVYTDGRSRDQVSGQLKNLARTIDTRGWAIRDNDPTNPVSQFPSSGRLMEIKELPQVKQVAEIHSVEDPYDISSDTSSNFDRLLSEQHDQLMVQAQQVNASVEPTPTPAPQQDTTAVMQDSPDPSPAPVVEQPQPSLSTQATQPAATDEEDDTTEITKTEEADPAILSLSHNDELPVSEIERQAKKVEQEGEISEGEGIISLH
jgi:hypothetical protein